MIKTAYSAQYILLDFCRYNIHSRGFTLVALMASNTSLNSGFSWRNSMFGLSPMVSKAERSTSPVMLGSLSKVVCKSIENLSFFLYYCLIIKVSKLRCTPLLWPLYVSQCIVKSFHIFFYSATCWNSSAFAFHLWDFISLVYCCRFRRLPVSFALFDLAISPLH